MFFGQVHHLSEVQVCLWQSATVEAAGRGEGEFAEVSLALFQVEVGTHKWERLGERFRILKELVHAFRFGNGEALRGSLPLTIQALQLPIPVEEVEIRFFLCATTNTA